MSFLSNDISSRVIKSTNLLIYQSFGIKLKITSAHTKTTTPTCYTDDNDTKTVDKMVVDKMSLDKLTCN